VKNSGLQKTREEFRRGNPGQLKKVKEIRYILQGLVISVEGISRLEGKKKAQRKRP